jgi:hypothetical protein
MYESNLANNTLSFNLRSFTKSKSISDSSLAKLLRDKIVKNKDLVLLECTTPYNSTYFGYTNKL